LSNTWTANNFTTSGTGTDVMSDTPTTNWCTLNPKLQLRTTRLCLHPTHGLQGTLSTDNLPAPDIADGSQYFDTLTWTGDSSGASRTLSGLAFGPDLVWAKGRNQAISHQLTDIVRGAGATSLRTDDQRVEGFETTSSSTNVYYNTNTYTYAAWCWDAGGAGSNNTDGTHHQHGKRQPIRWVLDCYLGRIHCKWHCWA
jgi:hypothetical protein